MESLNSERAPYGRQPKPAERRGVDSTRPGYQCETYYGQPVLKSSHYGQLIASYLFIGGIAGASQIIATICAHRSAGTTCCGSSGARRRCRLVHGPLLPLEG